MQDYYKVIADGYIVGIGTNGNDSVTEITETEYNEILDIIHAAPTAPEGYQYRLRADTLEWELIEDPGPEPGDEDATEQDYQDALEQMGVNFNENA